MAKFESISTDVTDCYLYNQVYVRLRPSDPVAVDCGYLSKYREDHREVAVMPFIRMACGDLIVSCKWGDNPQIGDVSVHKTKPPCRHTVTVVKVFDENSIVVCSDHPIPMSDVSFGWIELDGQRCMLIASEGLLRVSVKNRWVVGDTIRARIWLDVSVEV